ncbi:unnamed protein product [Cyclocybe aegerita]|uniref:Uncharacterized protein n=1 Tax=Cyclocybe aegerita TaxID=1973307 RepID=A0A8S0WJA0_CYCAE|nr:unnamed protein product [Cyclocybe aegerita]
MTAAVGAPFTPTLCPRSLPLTLFHPSLVPHSPTVSPSALCPLPSPSPSCPRPTLVCPSFARPLTLPSPSPSCPHPTLSPSNTLPSRPPRPCPLPTLPLPVALSPICPPLPLTHLAVSPPPPPRQSQNDNGRQDNNGWGTLPRPVTLCPALSPSALPSHPSSTPQPPLARPLLTLALSLASHCHLTPRCPSIEANITEGNEKWYKRAGGDNEQPKSSTSSRGENER